MSKKLTPLQALNNIANIEMKEQYKIYKGGFAYRVVSDEYSKELKIIETALKDYEHSQQQRELYFKQAKELKECYENELKNSAYYNNLALKYKRVLEMFKENLVVSYDESKNDKPCLILGIKVSKDNLVVIYETFDKEKIDFLKEALL